MEKTEKSGTDLGQVSEQLGKTIRQFRRQLYGKTPDILRQKGTCLRMKNTALQIATLLVETTGQKKLPIDLNPICNQMSVHTVLKDDHLTAYVSELCPDSLGFTVRISSRENGVRRRAAIAHEIGHTLFYDTTKLPPVSVFSRILRSPRDDKQEWISWDFARELLLPRKFIADLSALRFPSAKEIVNYARKCGVSVELLCHRMVRDLGFWGSSVISTFTLTENRIDQATIRIYRGKDFPRFRLTGKEGLLTFSTQFAELAEHLHESERLDDCLDWYGIPIWVQLMKYSDSPSRAIGVFEAPTLDQQEDNPCQLS